MKSTPDYSSSTRYGTVRTPSRASIAIVDDDDAFGWAAALALAAHHDVRRFISAPSLVDAIVEGARYTMLLVDARMRTMDAFAMFRLLRSIAPRQGQRVFFLTTRDAERVPPDVVGRVFHRPASVDELFGLVAARLAELQR